MKKLIAGLMALAAVATVAQAEGVYSKNAVGFINKDVAAEQLVALTIPFVNMDSDNGNWVFTETTLAKDAPNNSTVYFWDGAGWAPFSKDRRLGFRTDHELQPGECFFFQPADDMTIVMAGEVPADENLQVPVVGGGSLSALGSPYPVDVSFTNSQLAVSAANNSTVYFWDGAGWAPFSKDRRLGFRTDYVLKPGEGFFFQTVNDEDSKFWEVEKPYEFP